jgi:hypothetical protein
MEVTRDERLVERVMQEVRAEVRRHAEHQKWAAGALQRLLVVLAEIDTKELVAEHREKHTPPPEFDLTLSDYKRCEETIDHKRCRLPYGHDSHRGDGILWMPSADRSEVEQAREDAFLHGLRQGYDKGFLAALSRFRTATVQAANHLRDAEDARERETNAFINQEKR